MTITLAISGALGRMGQTILRLASLDPAFKIACLIDKDSTSGGNICVGLKERVGCLIDFSSVEGTMQRVRECVRLNVPMVIGTTGFTGEQEDLIAEAGKDIPIVKDSNMSIGVNIVFSMLEHINKRVQGFQIAIHETHHVMKKDKPSGTAKTMNALLGGRADIASFRLADIVGQHSVILAGAGEKITISHDAYSRDIFGQGALRAAKYICDKKAGLYSMRDVIDEHA